MKVLFDTNIILDLLLDRAPFVESVAQLFSKVEQGDLIGCLCATTITTISYLTAKAVEGKKARKEIQKLLTLFEIAPVNRAVLQAAIYSGASDFEDGVIGEAAVFVEADGIVTRDPKGFKKTKLRIFSPRELLQMLSDREQTPDNIQNTDKGRLE
jgi:predicted nucleic acid-binding protein